MKTKITPFIFLICTVAHAMETTSIKKIPVLTHNQCAKAIYNKTLTDEQLTVFAQHLLAQRIDYWKTELKKEEENNDTKKTNKIPLYIRLLPNVCPDEMLDSCKIISKNDTCSSCNACTKKLKNGSCSITMSYKSMNHSALFFKTLNHELTHVEQKTNALALNNLAGTKNKSLCNDDAQRIYNEYKNNTNFKNNKKQIITSFINEDEAENHAFKFYHNPYLLETTYKKRYQKPTIKYKEITLGYFGKKENLEHSQKYAREYYKKHPEKLFEDQLQTLLWQSKIYLKSNALPEVFYSNPKYATLLSMYIIVKNNYKLFNKKNV